MKGFALGLALKQRSKATQKSPIEPGGSTNITDIQGEKWTNVLLIGSINK